MARGIGEQKKLLVAEAARLLCSDDAPLDSPILKWLASPSFGTRSDHWEWLSRALGRELASQQWTRFPTKLRDFLAANSDRNRPGTGRAFCPSAFAAEILRDGFEVEASSAALDLIERLDAETSAARAQIAETSGKKKPRPAPPALSKIALPSDMAAPSEPRFLFEAVTKRPQLFDSAFEEALWKFSNSALYHPSKHPLSRAFLVDILEARPDRAHAAASRIMDSTRHCESIKNNPEAAARLIDGLELCEAKGFDWLDASSSKTPGRRPFDSAYDSNLPQALAKAKAALGDDAFWRLCLDRAKSPPADASKCWDTSISRACDLAEIAAAFEASEPAPKEIFIACIEIASGGDPNDFHEFTDFFRQLFDRSDLLAQCDPNAFEAIRDPSNRRQAASASSPTSPLLWLEGALSGKKCWPSGMPLAVETAKLLRDFGAPWPWPGQSIEAASMVQGGSGERSMAELIQWNIVSAMPFAKPSAPKML